MVTVRLADCDSPRVSQVGVEPVVTVLLTTLQLPWTEPLMMPEFEALPLQMLTDVVAGWAGAGGGGGGVGAGLGGGTGAGAATLGVALTGLPQLARIAKAKRPFIMTTKAAKRLLRKETLGGRVKKAVPPLDTLVLPEMLSRPAVMALVATMLPLLPKTLPALLTLPASTLTALVFIAVTSDEEMPKKL